MDTYILDGKKYYYKNGKWLTSGFMSVPTSMISRLNRLLEESDDLEDKSVKELMEVLDAAKQSGNTQLAKKVAERAMEIASINERRLLLPRLTSIYRQIGQPQRAVEIAQDSITQYGKTILSSALFTSMAAAYCDLNQLETARICANKAKSLSAGKSSGELINVYARLKKLQGV